MTYHPDSVLVEKVARRFAIALTGSKWEDLNTIEKFHIMRQAEQIVPMVAPLVAGVIADRLDEARDDTRGESTVSRSFACAARIVRREFVDGEA